MVKISSRSSGRLPKRWRKRITYGIYLIILTFTAIVEQLGKRAKRLKAYIKKRQAVATAAAMVSLVLLAVIVSATMHSSAVEQDIITYSTDAPSEVKPDQTYEWKGRPEDPKKITIPNAQTDGLIQKVGKDQHGQVAVPNNIHIAGWFVDSARPGQLGLSVIDGHVDGRSETSGVFKQINRLSDGDTFQVELGSGTTLHYKVRSVHSVDTDQAASTLFSQVPSIASQLNLITCGGNYDRESRDYDKRIIVVGELVVD